MVNKTIVQTTDNLIHKHLHTSLLVIKIPLIIFTLVYFILVGVVYIIEKKGNNKNDPNLLKLRDNLAYINNVLFYIIIGIILLLSVILMFITRNSSLHVFQKTFGMKENKNISIPKEQLLYYMSLNWWMLFYLMIVTIFVTIAKIKHDPGLIYNLF